MEVFNLNCFDMEGWIKLHRKLKSWEWYHKSDMVHLFVHLLISANHKDSKWQGIEIKRGQLVTGLSSINKETSISIQSIRTCIKRLKSTNEITIKSTSKNSIITVCNYDDYNDIINDTNRQINKQTNKQSTNNQQTTNNKQEGKELKNVNKEEYISKIQEKFYQSLITFVDEFGKETIRDFYEYWSEPNKSKTKIRFQLEKTWDTKKRLQRWTKNNFNEKNRTNSRNDFKSDITKQAIESVENGFTDYVHPDFKQ